MRRRGFCCRAPDHSEYEIGPESSRECDDGHNNVECAGGEALCFRSVAHDQGAASLPMIAQKVAQELEFVGAAAAFTPRQSDGAVAAFAGRVHLHPGVFQH